MTDSKTNEVVEAMARAISLHTFANTKCGPATDCGEWEDMTDYDRVTYRRAARAALTASEPLLAQARAQAVEDAAKVAGDLAKQWGERWIKHNDGKPEQQRDYQNGRLAGYSDGAAEVERTIRALAQSEGEGKA